MRQLLLSVCGAAVLSGCAVNLAPTTPYIPVIQERGQAEVKLSSSITAKQLELQLGYQLTDRVVLHASGLSLSRKKRGTRFGSVDLGLGYYFPLRNERWRLGTHAGLAYGGGDSGADFCFDCNGPLFFYKSRYSYAYLQPTAIFTNGDESWGLGLRVSQAYFHQLDEERTEILLSGSGTELFDRSGNTFTFLQPTFQFSQRLRNKIQLSGSVGVQTSISKRSFLDLVNPFIAQVNLHFLIGPIGGPKNAPQP